MNKILIFPIIAILLFLVSFSISNASAASTYDLKIGNPNKICENVLGGIWISATNTCTISNYNWDSNTFNSGDIFTIDKGVTLIVTGNGAIVNFGAIINYGTIIVNLAQVVINFVPNGPIQNAGTITNYGTITGDPGTVIGSNCGTITNYGTINDLPQPNPISTISNYCAFYQQIEPVGGEIDNYGIINNAGSIDNGGLLNNLHIINNICTGSISESGNSPGGFGPYSGSYEGINPINIPCLSTIIAAPSTAIIKTLVGLSANPTGGLAPYSFLWTMTGPTGSKATLSSSTVQNPTFTPDVIGNYQLSLTVTDFSGSTATATKRVSVITPEKAMTSLIKTILGMGLPNGAQTSLVSTLKNININNPSACGKLDAFITKVNLDLAKGLLTATQASNLLSEANAIKAAIGCP